LDNGANHVYHIQVVDEPEVDVSPDGFDDCKVSFQDGPVKETGINGIHNEDLLVIVLDRLEGFQRGQFEAETQSSCPIHRQQRRSKGLAGDIRRPVSTDSSVEFVE